jgi:hypothetical protein
MRRSGALEEGGRLMRELANATVASHRAKSRHVPHPPSTGLVLDVGGGQAPHARADVVVDKYVADDFERGYALDYSKPLVVGDGQALPFADGAFTYVITSHVLEHATDPVRFADELGRVAAAGFVQVPSRESELTFGWRFHPWLIDEEEGMLVFHPRQDAQAPIGQVFHDAMAESVLFRLWFASNRDRWHHSLEWHGSLKLRCEGTSRALESATVDVSSTRETLSARARRGEVRGPLGTARAVLRCPVDQGELEFVKDVATCRSCGRSYPVVASVPILLVEAAT